ncbi:MAG: hypothetical protein AAF430_07510 [Myxococcota bacterium]
MRVYVLTFGSRSDLSRAFDRVLEDPQVASCMIEPEHRRLRFLGPLRLTERLVERIYQDGGLAWCSRHDFRDPAEERLGALTAA